MKFNILKSLSVCFASGLLFSGMTAASQEGVTDKQPQAESFGKRVLSVFSSLDKESFADQIAISQADYQWVWDQMTPAFRDKIPESQAPTSPDLQKSIESMRSRLGSEFTDLADAFRGLSLKEDATWSLAGARFEDSMKQDTMELFKNVVVDLDLKGGEEKHQGRYQLVFELCIGGEKGMKAMQGMGLLAIPKTQDHAALLDWVERSQPVQTSPETGLLASGSQAPNVKFQLVSTGESKRLKDLKGKVLVIDFWASWCGPCQAPMAKMQTYADKHPEFGDKVVYVAMSLDDSLETAKRHLERKGWDKTYNAWADSDVGRSFLIRGIPTVYILDQSGKVAQAGHPSTLDIPEVVKGLLN